MTRAQFIRRDVNGILRCLNGAGQVAFSIVKNAQLRFDAGYALVVGAKYGALYVQCLGQLLFGFLVLAPLRQDQSQGLQCRCVIRMIAGHGGLKDCYRLALIAFGQWVVAGPHCSGRQAVQRGGNREVLVAECTAIDVERFAEQFAGGLGIALALQFELSELLQNIGGLDRRGFIAAARQLKCLLQIGPGRDQVAAVRQRSRQVGQRRRRAMLVERMFLTTDGDRLFEQRNGAIAQSLTPVGESDALQ